MNILIVDDSVIYRSSIRSVLESSPEIKSIKIANNGKQALEILSYSSIDLITLDLEMPEMDGLETIKEIRKTNKNVIIIVFSSLTKAHAEKTLLALELGANDFVTKITETTGAEESLNMIRRDLLPKIEAFFKRLKSSGKSLVVKGPANKELIVEKPQLILIGSSTGGPEALKNLFSKLSGNIDCPILVVQHMPPIFTAQLAKYLEGCSKFKAKEAEDNESIQKGFVYVAPGDFHLTYEFEKESKRKYLKINKNEKNCFVRPSVNVTIESLIGKLDGHILISVLTGMGDDGTEGLKKLKDNHKKISVIIQDEESSVVWGMPGSIYEAKLCNQVCDLTTMASYINRYFEG